MSHDDPTLDSKASVSASVAPDTLPSGSLLASRYQIIELLGIGGSGAVYKAFDRQLSRHLALKTIRSDLAESPAAIVRFKQEVLLAQKVVHRNVVRVFDFGEDGNTKFITMELVEGTDLKVILREQGRLPIRRAVATAREVCAGLQAAHEAGVVHRDLKPQNVMVKKDGHILVMDFGIAHSIESAGMTMTGLFVGTPQYMSPEQVRGENADERSDIYSVGLILYEVLTGSIPFEGTTSVDTMYRRTHETPVPPNNVCPDVPNNLSKIVLRCLANNPAERYGNVAELLRDLEAHGEASNAPTPLKARRALSRRVKVVLGVAALLLITLATAIFVRHNRPQIVFQRSPITVLVADFENHTGDDVFDGTLESMCVIGLEEASFVNMFSRTQARNILKRINGNTAVLDTNAARIVATREGIGVVVGGSIELDNSGYKLTIEAIDPVPGKQLSRKQLQVNGRDRMLKNLGQLLAQIRTHLGDNTPQSVQLAAVETYTAGSIDAAHAYAQGQESLGFGKQTDAIRFYEQAVQLDPSLGRAYAGLAVASFNLKDLAQADVHYKKALSLIDRMSQRERYRTLGGYYVAVANNLDEGINTLRKLTTLFPADAAAYTNLSTAYKRAGRLSEAAEASRHAVEITPNNLLRRYNYAANSIAAGDFQTAIREAEEILRKDSTFVYAYLPLALSMLIQGDDAKASDLYHRLEKINPQGASLANIGSADQAIYSGKYQDAIGILIPGIAADEKEKSSGEIAQKLIALADAYNAVGRNSQAADAAKRGVKANPLDEGVHFLAALALIDAEDYSAAEQLASELEARLQTQTKALALMIRGYDALQHRKFGEALDRFRESQKLHDYWQSHLLLGRAYIEAGHYAEAIGQLEQSEKRAGEVTDLFDSNTTTLRYFPPTYYWLGRAHEGIAAMDAAHQSYRRFLSIRSGPDRTDNLVTDVRRRMN